MEGYYSKFDDCAMNTEPFEGYVIIGKRHGKYFHMYGDTDKHILFKDVDDYQGKITALDCPFVIFKNESEARDDMNALQKCCYNEDFDLEMMLGKCVVNEGVMCQRGKFVGCEACQSKEAYLENIIR